MEQIRQGEINGADGGYITTRGRPRYAMLNGEHYAVGRGVAWRCGSVAEAYGQRDKMIAAEKAAHATAPLAPGGTAPAVGARVRIEKGVGTVSEVGPRSVRVVMDDGTVWRRAACDCVGV
jgi:hypothetical protein